MEKQNNVDTPLAVADALRNGTVTFLKASLMIVQRIWYKSRSLTSISRTWPACGSALAPFMHVGPWPCRAHAAGRPATASAARHVDVRTRTLEACVCMQCTADTPRGLPAAAEKKAAGSLRAGAERTWRFHYEKVQVPTLQSRPASAARFNFTVEILIGPMKRPGNY